MRKISTIIVSILVIIVSVFSLSACSTSSFGSITKIKSFEDIERISIVYNNYIVEGHVSASTVKDYREDRDILEIYNVLARANYRKANVDETKIAKFDVRIYVKGHKGYIEYSWDNSFKAMDGYDGKLNEGGYSMDDAHLKMKAIEEIFYRD